MNEDLVRKTWDYIKLNPDKWDQDTWVAGEDGKGCGTTGCFAGTALMLEGYRPIKVSRREPFDRKVRDYWDMVSPTGEHIENDEIGDVARDELGLSWDQADRIFYYFTKEELHEGVLLPIGDRPVTLEEFQARLEEVTGLDLS